jgi:hypothetical protein
MNIHENTFYLDQHLTRGECGRGGTGDEGDGL